jgi:hypothetical protein
MAPLVVDARGVRTRATMSDFAATVLIPKQNLVLDLLNQAAPLLSIIRNPYN